MTYCSAVGCLSVVRRENRWCRSHRPAMEAPARSIIHRVARMILEDPGLTNRAITERTGAFKQQIVQARRLVGIPEREDYVDMRDDLDRCLVAARSRAMATVRHVDPAEVA